MNINFGTERNITRRLHWCYCCFQHVLCLS